MTQPTPDEILAKPSEHDAESYFAAARAKAGLDAEPAAETPRPSGSRRRGGPRRRGVEIAWDDDGGSFAGRYPLAASMLMALVMTAVVFGTTNFLFGRSTGFLAERSTERANALGDQLFSAEERNTELEAKVEELEDRIAAFADLEAKYIETAEDSTQVWHDAMDAIESLASVRPHLTEVDLLATLYFSAKWLAADLDEDPAAAAAIFAEQFEKTVEGVYLMLLEKGQIKPNPYVSSNPEGIEADAPSGDGETAAESGDADGPTS